jgi:hypothetical protein
MVRHIIDDNPYISVKVSTKDQESPAPQLQEYQTQVPNLERNNFMQNLPHQSHENQAI